MPTPLEFAALQDLQTALRTINVAAGYYRTVNTVAVKLDPNVAIDEFNRPLGPRPLIIVEFLEDKFEFDQANELKLKTPLVIHWIADAPDPADDSSLLKTFFEGCADVERAITGDISRGGRVTDTRITSRVMGFSGSEVWAEIKTDLKGRRQYGQPNV